MTSENYVVFFFWNSRDRIAQCHRTLYKPLQAIKSAVRYIHTPTPENPVKKDPEAPSRALKGPVLV
jgi:hypothetical protein